MNINDSQLAGIREKIALAKRDGARAAMEGPIEGRVVSPHAFADVTADMEIAREEIFRPLVGIIRAEDEADAVELANASNFVLGSAVFTQDTERGVRFGLGIKAGMTRINDMPVNDEAHVPFGEERNSTTGSASKPDAGSRSDPLLPEPEDLSVLGFRQAPKADLRTCPNPGGHVHRGRVRYETNGAPCRKAHPVADRLFGLRPFALNQIRTISASAGVNAARSSIQKAEAKALRAKKREEEQTAVASQVPEHNERPARRIG